MLIEYIGICMDLRSSPVAALKSVPSNALARHQGVRQRGLKLRVAPGS